MDAFSRYAIRVSVAQICQTIGWSKIQSTPLEVLTDFMEEYIVGLGRLANNYATLMGHSEPNLSHVSLAFRDMDVSFRELKEYITYFDSGCALEVPLYPIPKESHLNHLKPGSREVLTRPVHVHEHLPPMYPQLEDEEISSINSPNPDQSVEKSVPPLRIKIEPSFFVDDVDMKDLNQDDDVRPLRELSSVLMTTSGFLSSAREGKLPEVRSLPPEVVDGSETNKKSSADSIPKKKDKENRVKKKHLSEKSKHDKKSKHKKHKKSSHKRDKSDRKPDVPEKSVSSHNREKPTVLMKEDKTKDDKLPIPPEVSETVAVLENEIKIEKSSPAYSNSDQLPTQLNGSEFLNDESDEDNDLVAVVKSDENSYDDILKQHSSVESKGNVLIDIFSNSQGHGIGHAKNSFEDEKELIDVVNSSPLNSYNYSNLASPPIELADEDFDSQFNAGAIPPFGLPQRSTHIEFTKPSSSHSYERHTSRIDSGTTVHNTVIDNASPRARYRSISPVIKSEPGTPEIVENSDNRLLDTYTSKTVISPVSVSRSLMFDHDKRKPDSLPGSSDMHGVSDSERKGTEHHLIDKHSHSKKKKKKDKKNKEKDKVKLLTEDKISEDKHKSKKKKDHKKEKDSHISSSSKQDLFDIPPKKVKLENPWNGQDYLKSKDPVLPVMSETKTFKEKHSSQVQTKEKDTSTSNSTSLSHQHKKKSKHGDKKKEKKKEDMKHLSEDLFSFEPLKRAKGDEKPKSISPLPKITFKLGPSPPKINSETKAHKITIKTVPKPDEIPPAPSRHQPTSHLSGTSSIQSYEERSGSTAAVALKEPTTYSDQNQIWICPACNRPDDGSPMIACDKCDLWFHWICVGIREAIEGDWYCKMCVAVKQQDSMREKKKKHKKKKM